MLYKLIVALLLRRPCCLKAVRFRDEVYLLKLDPFLGPDFFQKIAEDAGILGSDGKFLSRDPL